MPASPLIDVLPFVLMHRSYPISYKNVKQERVRVSLYIYFEIMFLSNRLAKGKFKKNLRDKNDAFKIVGGV